MMSGIVMDTVPNSIKKKADIIDGRMKNIETQWTQISKAIDDTRAYWEGEAQKVHLRYGQDSGEDVRVILDEMKSGFYEIMRIAGGKDAIEEEAAKEHDALPGYFLI